jgi:thioredoxin 1
MGKAGKVTVIVALVGALAGVIAYKSMRSSQAPVAVAASSVGQTGVDSTAPGAEKPVPRLVDFGSTTCIPCKMMAPIIEEMQREYKGRLEVSFVDVVKDPAPGDAAKVQVIPTQVFYDTSGKELYRHEGFISKEDILAKWKELGSDFGKGASGGETL